MVISGGYSVFYSFSIRLSSLINQILFFEIYLNFKMLVSIYYKNNDKRDMQSCFIHISPVQGIKKFEIETTIKSVENNIATILLTLKFLVTFFSMISTELISSPDMPVIVSEFRDQCLIRYKIRFLISYLFRLYLRQFNYSDDSIYAWSYCFNCLSPLNKWTT